MKKFILFTIFFSSYIPGFSRIKPISTGSTQQVNVTGTATARIGKSVTTQTLFKVQSDTPHVKSSGIDTLVLNQQQITNLTLLGQVWGFLKYYHPAIAKGGYDFDAELFKVMPDVIKTKSNAELSTALEKWVDGFGVPELCKKCKLEIGEDIALPPDYGSIFNNHILGESLTAKLKYILNNRSLGAGYYLDIYPVANYPVFNHELSYSEMSYPDAGYRVLCLYRYWNIIQYFCPNKHLIGADWNDVLAAFIPRFVQASNKTDYLLTTLGLISSTHDSHADIGSGNPVLEDYRGIFTVPFQAKFIENKLTVTGFYKDTLDVKQKLRLGDVISGIDGISIEQLTQKYIPIIPASNQAALLRDLSRNYLLRSHGPSVSLTIVRDGKSQIVNIGTTLHSKLNTFIDFYPDPKVPAFNVLQGQIGYLFAGKYKNKDLPQMEKLFKETKGIIVDMRTYPSDAMAFTFVPFIKTGNAEAVKVSEISKSYPGVFKFAGQPNPRGSGKYKGKIVVIVNEVTQSLAEYTTMAFQASPNVTVIGSTTSGADGPACPIVLPGGIKTYMSGVGILYPDGTETQRKGVRIDYQIKATINGIKAGRDELLEKAVEIINSK